MKGYLNDFNIHGNRRQSSTRLEAERLRNKSQKSSIRNKTELRSITQSHNSVSTHQNPKSKPKKQYPLQIIEAKLRKGHIRTNTEFQLDPHAEERPGSGFGKTLSRKRLKTELGNYNGVTIQVVKRETKPVKVEDNFINGLVKARLHLEKKQNKNLGQEVKQIAKFTHQVKNKVSKNPEEKDDNHGSRRIMEQNFEELQALLKQSGQTGREEALCGLVQALLNRLKNEEINGQSQRLIRVVRQLEERNVRLMRLVNYMKGRGIDVDLYWNESSLS